MFIAELHTLRMTSPWTLIADLRSLQERLLGLSDLLLALLLVLNGLFCIALSPAQVLLHRGMTSSKFTSNLEVVNEKSLGDPIIAEFVAFLFGKGLG